MPSMMHEPSRRLLRIGTLAHAVGLSTDSIRHYERLGLLSPHGRTDGGFRLYAPEAVRRVRVIQAALLAGLSLDELAQVFAEKRAGRAPCRRVRELAARRLDEVEAEIVRLHALRDALRATLSDWDGRLLGAPKGQPAGLLEALADALSETRP